MKDLKTVIAALEKCRMMEDEAWCRECPYYGADEPCKQLDRDAVEWLKKLLPEEKQ